MAKLQSTGSISVAVLLVNIVSPATVIVTVFTKSPTNVAGVVMVTEYTTLSPPVISTVSCKAPFIVPIAFVVAPPYVVAVHVTFPALTPTGKGSETTPPVKFGPRFLAVIL